MTVVVAMACGGVGGGGVGGGDVVRPNWEGMGVVVAADRERVGACGGVRHAARES